MLIIDCSPITVRYVLKCCIPPMQMAYDFRAVHFSPFRVKLNVGQRSGSCHLETADLSSAHQVNKTKKCSLSCYLRVDLSADTNQKCYCK